jgi:hypothetical protein
MACIQSVETTPPTGKRVRVGAVEGSLDFLGSYTTLSWAQHGVCLTLVSSLAYPEVLDLAATLEALPSIERAAPRKHANRDHDQRGDQQNVNETTQRVRAHHSQRPQHEQHDGDGPEHG